MQYGMIKRYRQQQRHAGIFRFLKNPVFVLGLDLPFLVVASVSLRGAAAMSIEMAVVHMVTLLLAVYTTRALPSWSKSAVGAGISTLAMVCARMLLLNLFPGIINSLGMYMYLMALNGATFVRVSALSRDSRLWPVLREAAGDVLYFTVAAFAVSALREYMGNGALWGVAIPAPIKLSGLTIPFAGFIILGFLFAGINYLRKKGGTLMLLEAARREARYTALGKPGKSE